MDYSSMTIKELHSIYFNSGLEIAKREWWIILIIVVVGLFIAYINDITNN